ncbi:MAG: hypothetical protein OJF52_001233 [Nitrospira sp.]|nr:MAG: hypothetical protein OJF52_001233 [Nitrospira sp.]
MNLSFVNREASFARHQVIASSIDQRSTLFPFLRFTRHPSRVTGLL